MRSRYRHAAIERVIDEGDGTQIPPRSPRNSAGKDKLLDFFVGQVMKATPQGQPGEDERDAAPENRGAEGCNRRTATARVIGQRRSGLSA